MSTSRIAPPSTTLHRTVFTVVAAAALAATGMAGAQTKTIYIGMNGGTFE